MMSEHYKVFWRFFIIATMYDTHVFNGLIVCCFLFSYCVALIKCMMMWIMVLYNLTSRYNLQKTLDCYAERMSGTQLWLRVLMDSIL